MALGKRVRDTDQDEGAGSAGNAAEGAKRRRMVQVGLGLLSALVDKVFNATASVFGHRGDNRARIEGGNAAMDASAAPAQPPPVPASSAGANPWQIPEPRPPRSSMQMSRRGQMDPQEHGAIGEDGGGGRARTGPRTGSRTGARSDSCTHVWLSGDGGRGGPFARRTGADVSSESVKSGVVGFGQRGAAVDFAEGTRRGLPRLADADALRHALSFLQATDLARFARTSTSAHQVVATHAALEIADRYSSLRLGVREPPHPQASQRRLAFGTPSSSAAAAGVAAAAAAAVVAAAAASGVAGAVPVNASHGGAGGADVGHGGAVSVPPPPLIDPNNTLQPPQPPQAAIPHSALWDQEVVVARVAGSPGPSLSGGGGSGGGGGSCAGSGAPTGLRRRGRGSGRGAGPARCDGRNLELALPALQYLESCGDLLLGQVKTLPRLDLFRTLQSRTVLGPSQFLTAHMRAVLVDWMVEVAFQFRLSTISLHAAVSALDVCLSKVAVPRCRLQLLGVVCAMIQSQAGGGCQVMSTTEAIHICDSQYNPSQVHSTFNIVVSNTQEATSRTVPATAAEILNRLLFSMGEASGLVRPLSVDWEKQPAVKEEFVLAGLLIDLSLLDQYMFRFRPGTLAGAALFLARVTCIYFSKEEVWVTPVAVVEKNNREVLRLYGDGVCRPFVPLDEELEKRPFGAPGLGEFVASQPREAGAVRKCVDRLWLVQQDFLRHLLGQQAAQTVLFRYQHMFKGIKDKFVPPGSKRLQAYQRLGLVPKTMLDSMLDKHLPSTAAPHNPAAFRDPVGAASVPSWPGGAAGAAGAVGSSGVGGAHGGGSASVTL